MTLALSIRQPWVHCILHYGKDIENRDWPTKVRGRILIHASQKIDVDDIEDGRMIASQAAKRPISEFPPPDAYLAGGIVGEVEIIDCVNRSSSPWFFGDYGFVLQNAKPLPFRPLKGRLGFFDVDETALYGAAP